MKKLMLKLLKTKVGQIIAKEIALAFLDELSSKIHSSEKIPSALKAPLQNILIEEQEVLFRKLDALK